MTLIMSLVGMMTLFAIALLFSTDRRAIRLRTVGGAFAIQAGLGAFVLYVPVGQTEAPLVVRPFIARMTPSQQFAVMGGGLASVAGSVLAGTLSNLMSATLAGFFLALSALG